MRKSKNKRFWFSIILIIATSILVYYSLLFLINGITVDYQRSTGPDFIVVKGCNILKKEYHNRRDIKYGEIYVDVNLDNNYRYLNNSQYVIIGQAQGFKCVDSDCHEKFPHIQVKWIVSKPTVFTLQIISILLVVVLIGQLIRTVFYQINRQIKNNE